MAAASAPSRLFVDSSAWLAFFSARDQHHAEADDLFRRAAGNRARLLTSNLVVAEVHRLLLFRAGIEPARRALERIEASTLVALQFATSAHHRAACRWLARLADQKLTYTDAVSFSLMEAARIKTVLTFDRDFRIAGFEVWS